MNPRPPHCRTAREAGIAEIASDISVFWRCRLFEIFCPRSKFRQMKNASWWIFMKMNGIAYLLFHLFFKKTQAYFILIIILEQVW